MKFDKGMPIMLALAALWVWAVIGVDWRVSAQDAQQEYQYKMVAGPKWEPPKLGFGAALRDDPRARAEDEAEFAAYKISYKKKLTDFLNKHGKDGWRLLDRSHTCGVIFEKEK